MTDRYAVEFAASAARAVRKLDHVTRARVATAIGMLRDVPRPPAATSLAGPDGLLRVQVGDHRIVYLVEDNVLVVLVVAVGHRREVYRAF